MIKTKKCFNKILQPYRVIAQEVCGNYNDIQMHMGPEFCCFPDKNYISQIDIPLIEEQIGQKMFNTKMKNKLEKANINDNISNELLSFLHEIGHIYTYNKFYAMTYTIMAGMIQKLYKAPINKNVKERLQKIYFNLALERRADQWAIDYIKNNLEQVKQWDVMLTNNYKKHLPRLCKLVPDLLQESEQ